LQEQRGRFVACAKLGAVEQRERPRLCRAYSFAPEICAASRTG
jgi:hypothetical protein